MSLLFLGSRRNVSLGRGMLYVKSWPTPTTPPLDSERGRWLGECTAFNIANDMQYRDRWDADRIPRTLVDSDPVSIRLTAAIIASEQLRANLFSWFCADEEPGSTQPAGPGSIEFDDVVVGETYDLGHRNILTATVAADSSPIVEGTDYRLDRAGGFLTLLETGSVTQYASLQVDFTAAAQVVIPASIARRATNLVKLTFQSNDDGAGAVGRDRFTFWRCQLGPDGTYGGILDTFRAMNFRAQILADHEFHPADWYGTVERLG